MGFPKPHTHISALTVLAMVEKYKQVIKNYKWKENDLLIVQFSHM